MDFGSTSIGPRSRTASAALGVVAGSARLAITFSHASRLGSLSVCFLCYILPVSGFDHASVLPIVVVVDADVYTENQR